MKSASWAGEPPTRAPEMAAATVRIALSADLPALVDASGRAQASITLDSPAVQAASSTTWTPAGIGRAKVAVTGARISVGRRTPTPIPDAASASTPARASAGAETAVVVARGSPRLMENTGTISTPSATSDPTADATR